MDSPQLAKTGRGGQCLRVLFVNEKTMKITWLSSLVYVLTVPAPRPHAPTTKSTLNTAEPKMVPIPMSPSVMKTPMIRKHNSSLNLFEGVASHLQKVHSLSKLREFPGGFSAHVHYI